MTGQTADDPQTMLRLLVVEDEELNRKLLRTVIERRAHPRIRSAELLEAATFAAARALIAAGGLDLVVLDVRLPDGSGLDLARELLAMAEEGRPRVIVLSASVRDSDREQAVSAGADAFLGKPYRPAELLALLEHLLIDQPA